jgi:hypothetical protein
MGWPLLVRVWRLIADISIFRSIRLGNVPIPFSNHLRQTFGPGRGMLCSDNHGNR